MNNNLMIFENPEFGELRSLHMNGEPWFVGRDVAMALGYGKGKSLNNAVSKHVDDERRPRPCCGVGVETLPDQPACRCADCCLLRLCCGGNGGFVTHKIGAPALARAVGMLHHMQAEALAEGMI